MRLGLTLNYATDPRRQLDRLPALERAGLDVVWVAEAYGYDAATLMGYVAARTERLQIGAGVLPVYSRTPTLIAQTAAGLDAVSGGRAILGLGSSGPQVVEGWHGVAFDRPVDRTREVMEVCRQAWRHERVVHDGLHPIPLPAGRGTGLGKPLKLITRPLRSGIPIYVAALGERNVRLAAEAADGWLPAFFVPEKAAGVWGAALAAGTRERDPALAPLEIAAGGPLAIGDDVGHLLRRARAGLALYLGGMGARGRNFYNELAGRYGYAAEARTVQELYLAGRKAEAAAAVPAELVALTSLIGSESHVRERVEAFRAAGVTVLNVEPLLPDVAGQIARLRPWV